MTASFSVKSCGIIWRNDTKVVITQTPHTAAIKIVERTTSAISLISLRPKACDTQIVVAEPSDKTIRKVQLP